MRTRSRYSRCLIGPAAYEWSRPPISPEWSADRPPIPHRSVLDCVVVPDPHEKESKAHVEVPPADGSAKLARKRD